MTPLGTYLKTAREARRLTLRAVEESTGVSNAYLSQLESGKIREPSPQILFKLSKVYGVSYTEAMRNAGYPVPESPQPQPLARYGEITPQEEEELARYLEFLRQRRKKR